jgi:hypothetical protein
MSMMSLGTVVEVNVRRQRLALFALIFAILGFGAFRTRLAGQTPAGRGVAAGNRSARAVPRASDGHPDLQGVWSFATLTPLERPAELTGKAVLTDEEARTYEQQVLARNNADRRDGPVEADVARAYNNFWYDRGLQLAVLDGKKRTSLISDPPDGKIPALTPDAQRKGNERASLRREHAFDDPEARSLGERCLSFNAGPPMLPGPYNNYVKLLQSQGALVIANEMIHDARMVPLDGRPHLPSAVHVWLGDSRGRWEGDTLVVDTKNFTDRTNFRGADENLHLTERFTRVDAGTLVYQFTVDDPTAFSKPWTAMVPMQHVDEEIYEYACHEGNYGLAGILRGARSKEAGRTGK